MDSMAPMSKCERTMASSSVAKVSRPAPAPPPPPPPPRPPAVSPAAGESSPDDVARGKPPEDVEMGSCGSDMGEFTPGIGQSAARIQRDRRTETSRAAQGCGEGLCFVDP